MGAARMLLPWRACLQQEALPHLHGHQIKALAEASFAMAQAQHYQLSRMAVITPGHARVPSYERRWQRLIANERINVPQTAEAWAATVRRQELERADGRTLSVFQPGLRFLQRLLLTGQPPPAPKSVGW
jgi:hypothetical protein